MLFFKKDTREERIFEIFKILVKKYDRVPMQIMEQDTAKLSKRAIEIYNTFNSIMKEE